MTRAGVLESIRHHLEASGLGADTTVDILKWGEPGETPVDARIVAAACSGYEHEFGRKPAIRGISGYTDGGCLATRAGIPAVMAFGPGGIAGCHVPDEWVATSELRAYSRAYAGTIITFLANKECPTGN
jgi:acetylornithine deacetylase/succinyl-diaminopimelate desuccinylase-like protein